jgi:FkbM family methyltransferase
MIHESEIELYKSLLPQLKVVFDVGCKNDNIFYELNPNIEVHLFDPQYRPDVEGKLKVYYNNYALGSKKAIVDFHYHYESILLRDDEPKFAGLHQVRKIKENTLYNYCRAKGISKIDLLKIDAEGYDIEVIRGCGKMLPNIKYIQFEVWDSTIKDTLEIFEGYNIYEVGGKPLNLMATKERMDLKHY